MNQVFHARFDSYAHLLAGLPSGVEYAVAPDIRAAQQYHVYEAHSSGTIAEDEHVPGQVQRPGPAQVQLHQPYHDVFADGSFPGLVYSGVYILKRMGLECESLFDGLVVDGAEGAHVEGDGIAAYFAP